MKKTLYFLAVMVFLIFTSVCFAATVEEQFKEFENKAAQGDANAQYNLGSAYAQGNYGEPKDIAKAIEWYEKAGLQGHTRALNLLGNMYYFGIDVPQDMNKAKEWYKLACDKDYTQSCEKYDEIIKRGY